MTNNVKYVLILGIICLYLSGCKNVSHESNIEHHSSYFAASSEQFGTDYKAKFESTAEQYETIENHITRETTVKCVIEPSETRTIKFDLDIPEVCEFTYCNYEFSKVGQYNIGDIVQIFFGERAKDFSAFEDCVIQIYHNSADVYDNSLAELDESKGRLYLVDGDAAALDFSSDNMLKNFDEMMINIAEDEAIAICDKFLNDCGITGYRYDYTLYYGAMQPAFYSIRYYYELDSLPTSSRISNGEGLCNLTFFVDDNGIVKIKGRLFDESSFRGKESISTAQIISPQKAIDYAEEQAAVIRCGNETPEFDKYFSDHGEGLLYLPVCEMRLGYWFSEYEGIKLAWIFYIGDNNVAEKSGAFAIDAVSGKVYYY